ncbi:hypothetical protein ACERNI_15590 [Camelimonas sp. ID_303_24]
MQVANFIDPAQKSAACDIYCQQARKNGNLTSRQTFMFHQGLRTPRRECPDLGHLAAQGNAPEVNARHMKP